jgi:hypothetical protein
MNAGEFVSELFLARDVAHINHLKTRSYAEHMALGSFYSDVVDLADTFAEAYQGLYSLLTITRITAECGEAFKFLSEQLTEIAQSRYDICDEEDTALQNIIDEVIALYSSTLYKLRFLK